MRRDFFDNRKPSLVAMVSGDNTRDVIAEVTNSLYAGADAFGIQLCRLKEEFRTEEELKKMFGACQGKPIYVTSYRTGQSAGYTYKQCVELLVRAYGCGATLLDIPADFYCPTRNGTTFDEEAVRRQKETVEMLHGLGADVLMSAHHADLLSEDEIIRHAFAQAERGADVVKLVTMCNTEEDVIFNLSIVGRLKRELGKPFLYLANGAYGRLIRQLSPTFGASMYLCVEHYTPDSTKAQTHLASTKLLRDNLFL